MTSKKITDHLIAWSGGDETALAPLMDQVHRRLVGLASTLLRSERVDHTLDAAGLVNEAFLRLVEQQRIGWRDRAHFFAIAAKMMRRILVDHARRRNSEKRGSAAYTLQLDQIEPGDEAQSPDLTVVDEALKELEGVDPQLAELVVLKFFGGLGRNDIAEVMGLSSATVSRRWRTARAWLYKYFEGQP
ncbi:MAG: ECF-type sigma factor [Acidobacteriota bacterium]